MKEIIGYNEDGTAQYASEEKPTKLVKGREVVFKTPDGRIIDKGHAIIECTCGNPEMGFDCVCSWVANHPGDREFTCEFCGMYKASTPRCNKCEEDSYEDEHEQPGEVE